MQASAEENEELKATLKGQAATAKRELNDMTATLQDAEVQPHR